MFPEYTGSPFIFRQKSFGSSMTHYYSVTGLVINTGIWTVVLLLIRRSILNLIERSGNNKGFKSIHRGMVGFLILFTTLNIGIGYIMLGNGFQEGLNYWYFNLDQEAKEWGVDCEGRIGVFLYPK